MTITPVSNALAENTNGSATAALVVPVGVTAAHLGVITTQTVDSGSDTVTIPGWTRQVSNPTGKGNEEIAVFTRDPNTGGEAAGATITATASAGNNITIAGRWWDTGGRGIEAVGTVYTRNGVAGTTTQFPGVAVASARDIILVGLDRTVGSPTLSSWSPSTPVDALYSISPDRASRAHGTLSASYAQASAGTTPTFTATLSGSSGNAMGVQLVVAAPATDTIPPTVPTDVTATVDSSSQITVTWTGSTDAVGVASYRLRRGGVDVTGATALAGTSFVDTTVSPSTSYTYTVSAVDAAGNRSAESTASSSVTTPSAGPSPVVATMGPFESEVSTSDLQIGWEVDGGASIRAVASLNSGLTSPIYGTTMSVPAAKWVTSRVTGLTANTKYYVGIEVDGTVIATGRGSYTTSKSGLTASKVITSSCQITGSDHTVFDRILAEAPDFFAHQGDIHYADLATYNDASWRAAFKSSMTATKFKALLAAVRMPYATDNHDGPGSNTLPGSNPWGAAVSTAVRQLTGEVYAVTTKGFQRTWVHAGVRYIMLDCWSHRSASTDTNSSSKTMLGLTQRAWFLNLLQTATEPAIIVFSHFPMYSNLVAGGRWGDFPDERIVIGNAINALSTVQRNKIINIGGDSHSINADDGANAMWGRPSLNASPMNQSGGLASGTWNIANIDVPDTDGVFSRLTFTPNGSNLDFTWDAVNQSGTVLATWSKSFPTSTISKLRAGVEIVSNIRVGTEAVTKVYVGTTQVWP